MFGLFGPTLAGKPIVGLDLSKIGDHDTSWLPPRFNMSSGSRVLEVADVARRAQDAEVDIYNLWLALSVAWDDAGRVIIGCKMGLVYIMDGWVGVPNRVLLDIQDKVANYGDHGLTSVLLFKGYLWITYMAENPQFGDNCVDSGQMDGRPLDQVYGCRVTGRLVRYPYADGEITGPEEVIVNGDVGSMLCGQFSTHSITNIIVGPDGFLYWSAGDGAAFTAPDGGQMGANPCDDDPGYQGAFRVQNPDRWNGKIMRMDPNTFKFEIVASGVRNPFRISTFRDKIIQSDTGWTLREEINMMATTDRNINFGWPCFEGPFINNEYAGFNHPTCQWMIDNNIDTKPFFYYDHPENVVGNVASISAVAGYNDRIYFGDFTMGWIKSMDENAGDIQTHCIDCYPVGLYQTSLGLVYIDYFHGAIKLVPDAGAPLATPSPSPAPPYVRIVPNTEEWRAGQTAPLQFEMTTNVEGREGGIYTWKATLLFDCKNNNCMAATLKEGYGGKILTIEAPPQNGTLEVFFSIKTYGSMGAANTIALPSAGDGLCVCNGIRTPVDPASLSGLAGRPNTGGSSGGGGSGVDTSSSGFLGGIIAAAAVVGLGLVGAGIFFWRKRAAGGASQAPAAASGGAVTASGDPSATASAAGQAGGKSKRNKQKISAAPTLASRRPDFNANLPPVTTAEDEASARAAKRHSPGQQAQQGGSGGGPRGSPVGDRKV